MDLIREAISAGMCGTVKTLDVKNALIGLGGVGLGAVWLNWYGWIIFLNFTLR